MASIKRRYSKDEFARRGDGIYESDVLPKLNPADEGKFVAIDIESSEYEVDADELRACDRLRARLPAAQIWIVRVGSRYVHALVAGTDGAQHDHGSRPIRRSPYPSDS